MPRHPSQGQVLIEKKAFCSWCRVVYDRGLVSGAGGNLSARMGEVVLVTPTGHSLRDMTPAVIVEMDIAGVVKRGGRPTREALMHLEILRRRPDINVVCHVHGDYIIAAGIMLKPGAASIPPITPGFAYAAYPLPLLPFLVPGSDELSMAVAEAISSSGRRAILLQSHGLVTVGSDYAEAVNIAEEIEEAAKIYVLTKGKAPSLPMVIAP
ncbi:class II aldolase/adducin family protein [bacterium]|nr:class II aldolase/adducin family protein [bacterium]